MLHPLIDETTMMLIGATVKRNQAKYATGDYRYRNMTEEDKVALDKGIRDTLFLERPLSDSAMHRGEVLGHLDMMMNTKAYREEFAKEDPERFGIYKLAHDEFLAKQYHDQYVNPTYPEEQSADKKE